METKNRVGCVIAVARTLIVMPIWYYLMYSVLVASSASELQMFLFWVYLPVSLALALAEVVSQYEYD